MSDLLAIPLVLIIAAVIGWFAKKTANSTSGNLTDSLEQARQTVQHPVTLQELVSSSTTFRLVILQNPLSPLKARPSEWLIPDPPTYSLLLNPAFSDFLQLLGSATQTIDIASYILTGQLILTILREAVKKGVKVHLIVDGFKQAEKAAKSFQRDGVLGQTVSVSELEKYGLHVRPYIGKSRRSQEAAWEQDEEREAKYGKRHFIPVRERTPDKPLCMFHCKHVIIDGRVVMFGSCDVSEDSFATHFDDFIVTNDTHFVQPFTQQFQDTWHDFRV